jgi:hypothetical protein
MPKKPTPRKISKDPQTSALIIAQALKTEALPITKKITTLKIKSQLDYAQAADLLKQLKDKSKQAVAKLEQILNPLDTVRESIIDLFDPFIKSVKLIEKDTKKKMLAFLAENKKQAAKIDTAFETGKIKKPKTYLGKVRQFEITSNAASVRTLRKLNIIDQTKIPRKYMIPDESLITSELKAGIKIPGCELIDVDNIAI